MGIDILSISLLIPSRPRALPDSRVWIEDLSSSVVRKKSMSEKNGSLLRITIKNKFGVVV